MKHDPEWISPPSFIFMAVFVLDSRDFMDEHGSPGFLVFSLFHENFTLERAGK